MGLVGLVSAVAFEGVVRWVGTAAALAVSPLAWHALATWPWWQARRARLPWALGLALGLLLLAPLVRGEPPASRDHGIHYYQVHLLVTELLPSGRLWGYSPSLNNGYPYGESYPVLGYLWMAAAHLLSLGAVSLRTSYAWGLAALLMASTAVAWWLAALVTRELAPDAAAPDAAAPDAAAARRARACSPAQAAGWAGLVAASLWLLDPGSSRQGGWIYLVFHGVWPQLLAATLWVASLGLTWRALVRPTPRRLALAVLALGASLWAHPFAILTAAASGLAWAVLVLLGLARGPGPWRTWLVVHVGGVVLGLGWLVTFLGGSDSLGREPVPWAPLAELGAELVRGTLLTGHWAVALPLTLVGAALVLRRGGAVGWAVLGLVVVMLVLASEDAITVLRLDLVVSGFENLQFPRYAIPLKPLLFTLAGAGVGGLLARRGAAAEPAPPPLDAVAWARRAAVGLLLAPLVATLAPQLSRLAPRPVGAIDTLAADDLGRAEADLLAALRDEAAALPPERPLCVAVMRAGMGGGTYPIFSIADAGGRLVLDSHIPTVNLEHALRRNVEAYAALGVTHVLHDLPVPGKEQKLAAALEEQGRYGPFTLERFVPPRGRSRRVAELRGSGTVEVRVDEAQRLELDVQGVRPGTLLVLGRAPHHRWRVTLDGEPLAVDAQRLDRGGMMGMGITLPGPGRVVVQYEVTAVERRALWASAALLVLCLVAVAWGGPPIALAEPGPRARKVAWIVVGVGGPVLAMAVIARQQARLERAWTEVATAILPSHDDGPPVLERDLVLDGAIGVTPSAARVCSGLLGRDVHEGCIEAAHAPSRSFLFRDPHMLRCLRISLPPKGEVALALPALVDDAHVIVGAIVRHDRSSSSRHVHFGARKVNRLVSNDAHDFWLDRRRFGEHPVLTVRNDGRGIEQVCVAAALVQRP